jgi:hypothetical protein
MVLSHIRDIAGHPEFPCSTISPDFRLLKLTLPHVVTPRMQSKIKLATIAYIAEVFNLFSIRNYTGGAVVSSGKSPINNKWQTEFFQLFDHFLHTAAPILDFIVQSDVFSLIEIVEALQNLLNGMRQLIAMDVWIRQKVMVSALSRSMHHN